MGLAIIGPGNRRPRTGISLDRLFCLLISITNNIASYGCEV